MKAKKVLSLALAACMISAALPISHVFADKDTYAVSDDAVSRVLVSDEAVTSFLGDNVALSVGGNGIYYANAKHDIDAPAYIVSERTLIPVRAVSEAFGLDVKWDDASKTAIIDGKSKITLNSADMVLPDGGTYKLDVPAQITNDRIFIPLRALCEQILGKKVTWHDKGIIIIGDREVAMTDKESDMVNNYLLYDRPTKAEITDIFNNVNKSSHPRVVIDEKIRDRAVYNYANDPDVKEWGDLMIGKADKVLGDRMPDYILNNGQLLNVSHEVNSRARLLGIAYILTKDPKYPEGLFKVFEAVKGFPDWNPSHFLDTGVMTAAVAIGYDWCYDHWSDEQKAFIEELIYEYGLKPAKAAYYGELTSGGWWTPGNVTNWNVVCNGGILMGAVAVFDRYPEFCADIIENSVRDVEAMMTSFYPDGAWMEGAGYWSFTMTYTVNMFSTLEACFGTDFNLSKAPGFNKTAFFNVAVDGNTGLNNFHDSAVDHQSSDTYFWLSNKFNLPGITNIRLYHMDARDYPPTPYDILWYDTSIKGTDFTMTKDTYMREVEFVSMTGSYVDDSSAWLSFHGGKSMVNHSHLDTGTFVFDLAGVRWAQDLGGDDYSLPGYFSDDKHKIYRMRPEAHNVYVIDPDESEGQTLDHFGKVETLISKDKGAYSILDMTDAYRNWVTKARRGYMLGDDRRSATVRDEIEFNKSGRELVWFMNTPKDAKIEIKDKNTAYITSKNVTLKFMIDSDIENYEFGTMDAVPMEKSPTVQGQNPNTGIKKLYLKGTAGARNFVECKMILSTDVYADEPLMLKNMDEWTIPDGVVREAPVLDMITVDGENLADFAPKTFEYGRTIRYTDTSVPVIGAAAADGLTVEITQATTPSEDATIKVAYADEPKNYRLYTYSTRVLPELTDVGEYTRMQVVAHSASAEPEKNHPAVNVSDNDTDPESRWAASNNAWIALDLGEAKAFDTIGIALWKGNAREYRFKIDISDDGVNWEEIIAERTSDTANGESIGIYPIGKEVTARYIRYSGTGNSVNQWNSITELAVLKKK